MSRESHTLTIRQQIAEELATRPSDARELSQAIGIREKEVYEHLAHISRSLRSQKKRLLIQPSRCLACGFVFENRKRITKPGRCPQCKSTRLVRPIYSIG